mmetsp:Transcript_75359/g.149055  ORF Transcript_75359/g.149055 Transcript_75359/m.149055 type:complete len:214 (+) Transcript_75359:1576-2217(+)
MAGGVTSEAKISACTFRGRRPECELLDECPPAWPSVSANVPPPSRESSLEHRSSFPRKFIATLCMAVTNSLISASSDNSSDLCATTLKRRRIGLTNILYMYVAHSCMSMMRCMSYPPLSSRFRSCWFCCALPPVRRRAGQHSMGACFRAAEKRRRNLAGTQHVVILTSSHISSGCASCTEITRISSLEATPVKLRSPAPGPPAPVPPNISSRP